MRKRKKEDEEIRSKIMREIQRMTKTYRKRKRKESRKMVRKRERIGRKNDIQSKVRTNK